MSTRAERSSRATWVLFLAGPVIWITHFMAVYLLAEEVCAADPIDTQVLGLHPLSFVTLVATAVAAVAASALAGVAFRRWRARRDPAADWLAGDELNPGLALAGALLGVVFVVAILFVGLPAALLEPC